MAYQGALIVDIREESPSVKTFTLQPDDPVSFSPGQYVKVKLPSKGKKASYTIISSANHSDTFDISVENHEHSKVGKFLHQMEAGDQVEISEVKGKFIVDPAENTKVFIARDIGITATLGMLRDLGDHEFRGEVIVFNFITPGFDEIYQEGMEQLQNILQLKYRVVDKDIIPEQVVDSGKLKGKHMELLFNELEDAHYYISGKSKFCKRLRKRLMKMGVERKQIRKEGFG